MPRLNKYEAQEALRRISGTGIGIPCFHSLPSDQVAQVLREADLVKYRKPKTANGSRARYFYEYLARTARKED